ncbi:MAG: trehalose-6-phosphate synthase [Chloroflexi bacterium]|nr:MAG: trehalose-6-phosphate synthase [Chloroflexota bacterium]
MTLPPELLVCSHRGPVSFETVDGRLVAREAGPGGLVQVVSPVLERFGGRWIFSVATPEDRRVARAEPRGRRMGRVVHQLLDLPAAVHRNHYRTISVEYLGYLFNRLFHLPTAPAWDDRLARAWADYRRVNAIYADAALRAPRSDVVLIEDYHLMLAAPAMREQGAAALPPLVYFHHVPWCEPEDLVVVPEGVRNEMLQALLAHDVVGFHCTRWARAFVACCERYVSGAVCTGDRVRWRGRSIRVVAAPAPIDVASVRAAASSSGVDDRVAELRSRAAGRWTLVRVDRADLWKNALRGLLAFERLLDRDPSLAGRIWFLAVLTPTRTWVAEYRRYLRACRAVAARVNRRHPPRAGQPDGPVTLMVADGLRADRDLALAAMRMGDGLLVNPTYDGLNLVAKEAVAVSGGGLVLILSENAGVHEELCEAALTVNPFDVVQTSEAIRRALDMPDDERTSRFRVLHHVVTTSTFDRWIARQLEPLGETVRSWRAR